MRAAKTPSPTRQEITSAMRAAAQFNEVNRHEPPWPESSPANTNLTNEAVNPLKLRQIIFWQVAKAVNMLKTG
jgi:hypothetical protein